MKNRRVLKVLLTTALMVAGLVATAVHPAVVYARDGVFIHISSGTDNPHRVLMALRMAGIMAEDKDVLVYFDIKGVDVVLKEAVELKHAAFPSSKEAIAALIEQNVPLYACPGCLKAAGKSAADLMAGVQVADKDAFFDFTEGRILTLDY